MNDITLIQNMIVANDERINELAAEIDVQAAQGYCVTPLENELEELQFTSLSLIMTVEILKDGAQQC